jgi:hypothetical protein
VHTLAFVVALVAAAAAGIDAWLSKSLLALAVCLFVVAFILQLTLTGGLVTFG